MNHTVSPNDQFTEVSIDELSQRLDLDPSAYWVVERIEGPTVFLRFKRFDEFAHGLRTDTFGIVVPRGEHPLNTLEAIKQALVGRLAFLMPLNPEAGTYLFEDRMITRLGWSE